MADNNETKNDELIDQEEYERALEALNKSKSARVKKIVEQKKENKAKAKEQEAKEASEEGEVSKPEAKSGFFHTFIAKSKKDPIIPLCVLLIFASLIFAVCYFVIPKLGTKTLGFTVDELRVNYLQGDLYLNNLAPYDFSIPDVTYQETMQIALTATAENNKKSDKLDYFSAGISNTAVSFNTAIQGSQRKSDGKITALRVIVEFPDGVDTSSYFNFLSLYFASYIQAVFPDVSSTDASQLAMDALSSISGQTYMVRGEVAYRVSIVNTDTVRYVTLDFLPADKI